MDSSAPPATEKTTGVRSIFSLAWAYRLAQWGIGAERFRDTFVRDVLRPVPSDRIIDIGCGTADILDHLPDVDYVGFDHSQRYIDSARARHPDRGRFERVEAGEFQPTTPDRTLAMAIGVLHHLDDDTAVEVFGLASASLAPGGRFVSIDPTIVDGQSPIARSSRRRIEARTSGPRNRRRSCSSPTSTMCRSWSVTTCCVCRTRTSSPRLGRPADASSRDRWLRTSNGSQPFEQARTCEVVRGHG